LKTDPPTEHFDGKDFWPIAIGLSSALISFALNLFKSGPSILGDELGYLSAANGLASEGSIYMGSGTTYHPGVSLVFSLALRLFEDPLIEYRGSLVANSLMLGIAMFLILKSLERIVAPSRWSFLPSIAMISIPGALYWSTFAMSETAVLLTFAFFIFYGLRLDQLNGRLRHFLCLGFFAGLTWVVHPRFIVLIPAVVVFLVVAKNLKRAGIFIFGSVVGLWTARVIVGRVIESIYVSSSDNLTGPLDNFFARDYVLMFQRFGGRLSVTSVASGGLVLLGARDVWLRRRSYPLFTSVVLLFPISVMLIAGNGGFSAVPQSFIYGRYHELLFLPLVALGSISLIERRVSIRHLVGLWALPLLGSLWLLAKTEIFESGYQISNSPGIVLLAEFWGRPRVPEALLAVTLVVIGMTLLFLKVPRILVSVLYVGCVAMSIGALRHSYQLDDMNPKHALFGDQVRLITQANEGPEVWIDRNSMNGNIWPHIFATQWALNDVSTRIYSGAPPDTADVIVHAGPIPNGYELVGVDPMTYFSLGRRTASNEPALQAPRDVSRDGLAGQISPDVRLERGGIRGAIVVTNTGDQPWFPRSGAYGSDGSIRVVGQILSTDGNNDEWRLDFPTVIAPGESFTFLMEREVSESATTFNLRLVAEGVSWFSSMGSDDVSIRLRD